MRSGPLVSATLDMQDPARLSERPRPFECHPNRYSLQVSPLHDLLDHVRELQSPDAQGFYPLQRETRLEAASQRHERGRKRGRLPGTLRRGHGSCQCDRGKWKPGRPYPRRISELISFPCSAARQQSLHRTRELTLKDGPGAEGVFKIMLAPPEGRQKRSSWFWNRPAAESDVEGSESKDGDDD